MIDDSTEAPAAGGHMTLWEHLAELRSRIVKCVLAIVIGAVVGWVIYSQLLDFLLRPLYDIQPDTTLIATSPLDGFAIRIQLSVYVGIAVAMPVLLWQIWRFVTPGLYPKEKRYAVPFVVSALLLFMLGAAIAYITLNPALRFLIDIGGSDIQPLYTPNNYVKLILFMMLAFGAGFEFPVLLVALEIAGVITPRQLSGWRRQAMVIIVIVAAVITPSGDPISMLALAIPMYIFYEISIVIGWAFNRRQRTKAAKAAAQAGSAQAGGPEGDS